jgi:hypothetical protein
MIDTTLNELLGILNIRISTIDEVSFMWQPECFTGYAVLYRTGMVGRPGFEPGIPWSLAAEHEFARPKPGIIAKLDHRPVRWSVLSGFVIRISFDSWTNATNNSVVGFKREC